MKLRSPLAVLVVALTGALAGALTGAACKRAPDPGAQPAPAAPAAQGSARDPWQGPPPPAKDPLPRPFLWTIERDGKTTHLLGTMHLGIDAEARLPDAVWRPLDAAAALAVETDITDRALARLGQRQGGTLRDDLGPDGWTRLEAALSPGVARALADKSPLVPATMLAMRGLPPTPPMDSVLVDRAKARGKRVVFLEPASKQAAILERHMNLKALQMMLADIPKLEAQSREMLAAYVAGDEARVLALAEQQRRDALAFGYTPAEYDQSLEDLLYERNASWIPAIERLHAEGRGFVAVGALHLIGPRSVLELLAQRGYRVARVTP